MLSYRVLTRPALGELTEKRSRFRCTLTRVGEEESARAVVEAARREFWDARHHCSAFVLGPPEGGVLRSNDDGEPAGTAGAPMLEVLRGGGVGDVVAVVTRWFGGTLLGAGGLVKAYSGAVKAALAVAELTERRLLRVLEVGVDHAAGARLEYELRARAEVVVLDTGYAENMVLTLGVPAERADQVRALVAEVSAGTATVTPAGERWVDLGVQI